MEIRPVSERALMIYCGHTINDHTLAHVQQCVAAIEQSMAGAVVDLTPSYGSVLVHFDPLRWRPVELARELRRVIEAATKRAASPARSIVLPVYYSQEVGPELAPLAERAGLSVAEAIMLHTATAYRVYAIGFAPGFAYLGEVDARLSAPRLESPRTAVPSGSVAIADRQTAVYPSESPGGWNLIGRCPVPMFDARQTPCMPVSVGDTVRFEAIDREQFLALGGSLL